ncbi:efflux RND transporter periplasmic adaptor subunit [Rhodoferax saidenbachensis]|uniref:Membrane fusion protein (Multidrug efflux system) n=1 Tax=Rhodoferax saidenbachensis TaxID=1484693 RepID=A0ABU1ZTT4_9BURK|nr:efflux RND transporter periplasmic adaptor subunit [Rhodoferax saidenbachensis]MDR7308823.1 membrane fusion protein (multidrug efflux system) [Rhodoferax saidenbachensis]
MLLFRQTLGHTPSILAGRVALLAIPLAVALVACGAKDGAAGAGGPGGGMPPAEVGVVTVASQSVALQSELPGRVSALRVAQVRARVSGVVLQRQFREGSEVKAGQVLYQLDSAPYRAAMESAQATVVKAQATLAQATAQVERNKPLAEANAISKQEFTTLVTTQRQAEADVGTAKAAAETARINLAYATITAPISGRIGQSSVTEGALVGAADTTALATIQQTASVYVNFTQSSTDVLRLRKAIASKQLRAAGDGSVPVRIVLEDGSELAKPGKLLFSDLTVDATSGQITLRAEVPNADGLLLPGQFVRVRLSQAELPSGILLPQQAVTRTNQGDTVLVVGEGGKPGPRPVKLGGNAVNNQWVILDGLKEGDQVIVDGFQKMMVPGAPVKPVPWSPNAAPAGAPAAAASAPAAAASAAAK